MEINQQKKLNSTLFGSTDNPVGVATSVVSKDLSDVTIDDDHSQLDEFLSSSTQLSGKWDHIFVSLQNPVYSSVS